MYIFLCYTFVWNLLIKYRVYIIIIIIQCIIM